MTSIKIKVKGGNYVAVLNQNNNEISVIYNGKKISASGEFPFIALAQIRKELEEDNIFLMINGSRRDVYPSGMSLYGFNAYIQLMGKPASLDLLVNIFDETNRDDLIGTVEEQTEYHKNWLASL